MRVAILCNGEDLALWQRRAVERIAGDHELLILACGNQPGPRRRLKHAAYYGLNLVTVRNRLTRRVPFPYNLPISERLDCTPSFAGNWADLPEAAIDWLKDRRVDAVVKFGLGLLRVPNQAALAVPILSYHHGDPRLYRGRPAGFWELTDGAPVVGQVIQILSNTLDAGAVLAFAESNAAAHSYRQTLLNAYALSPFLLPLALRALADGDRLPFQPVGENRRLPANFQVIRFVASRWAALVRRLAYGAFKEKRWNIATVDLPSAADPLVAMDGAERRRWNVPDIPRPYSFLADPFFFGTTADILAEGLHRWSGRGEIVRLRNGAAATLCHDGGHADRKSVV